MLANYNIVERIQRVSAYIVSHSWESWYLIVYHSGYMELKHLNIFLNYVRGSSILLVSNKLLVGFDNVSQFMSEIILQKESTKFVCMCVL